MHETIEGRGGALRICDGGRGEPAVVFVHALAGNHEHWRAALEHLRPRRRAIAFDLRGHGGSAPPRDGDFSIAAQADDLLAVLDARGLQRAVFVGHSLGAMVAIAAAAQAPDRCAGLFLVDPGSDPSAFPQEQVDHLLGLLGANYDPMIRARWEQLVAGGTEETRRLALGALAATPKETVLGGLGALGGIRAADALRSFPGKVFVLAGPMGAEADALQNVLGLQHRVLDGVSHFAHLDAPAAFLEALDAFLEAV